MLATIFSSQYTPLAAEESYDHDNLPAGFIIAFSAKSRKSFEYTKTLCDIIKQSQKYYWVPRICLCLDSDLFLDMEFLRERWKISLENIPGPDQPITNRSTLPLPGTIEELAQTCGIMDVLYLPCMPLYSLDMFANWKEMTAMQVY